MPKTKTFIATITPATIEKGDTTENVRYSKLPGATVQKRGRGGKMETITRTVMAFGRKNAAVANILRPGKPVVLECSFRGGMILIEGKGKATKTAKAA